MFKTTEVERKTRKINLLIDLQINISSCRTSYLYFSLLSSDFHADSIGTKNVIIYTCAKLKGKQIIAAEKMYHVYSPEIIQSTSLARLWKNHWNTMTACLQRPYQNGESENLQRTMSLVSKITFKQIVEVLFQCF